MSAYWPPSVASLPHAASLLLCPDYAAGCMLMVSCRRNGRKGRKSGFCVRNDFCAPHLNEGRLKWISYGCRVYEFKSTCHLPHISATYLPSTAGIDFFVVTRFPSQPRFLWQKGARSNSNPHQINFAPAPCNVEASN